MSIGDSTVHRIYKCTNQECEGKIRLSQKATDPWKKKCPFCKKRSLVIESADLNVSIVKDLHNPNTLGMVAQKNRQTKLQRGEIREEKKILPWWRKNKKINFDVLKNPKKYITDGTI